MTTTRATARRSPAPATDSAQLKRAAETENAKSARGTTAATMQRGKGHAVCDTTPAAKTTSSGAQPTALSTIQAFCIAPERKIAEWFLAAGGKIALEVTLDDGLMEIGNRLYHNFEGDPRYKAFQEALWHPERLHLYTPEPELINTTVVQYLRLHAARDFLSLWVTCDNIRSLAHPHTTDRWKQIEQSYADGTLSESEWSGINADLAAARALQEAFKSHCGVTQFWDTSALTPRELFQLVVVPHPPTSRQGKLLAALERFATHQAASTTWSHLDIKNTEMGRNLDQPRRCKALIDFAERMDVIVRQNASRVKATKP